MQNIIINIKYKINKNFKTKRISKVSCDNSIILFAEKCYVKCINVFFSNSQIISYMILLSIALIGVSTKYIITIARFNSREELLTNRAGKTVVETR